MKIEDRYEHKKCALCGAEQHEVIANKDRHGQALQTVICPECGFVFVDPSPSETDLGAFYRDQYREQYKKVHQPKAKHIFRSGRRALRRLRFLESINLPSNASILDIGAGDGSFVYVLGLAGYRAQGMEPHQGYAAFAQENFKVQIQNKTLQDHAFAPESFHAVTLHHVLEHLENPLTALRIIRKILMPAGLLVAEVPNIRALYHSPNRQFHKAHLFHFSEHTLARTAAQSGFTVVSLQKKPFTGHLLAVLRKADDMPPENSEKNNHEDYAQTRAALKGHDWPHHLLSAYPYQRLFMNMSRILSDMLLTRGEYDAKKIIDDLFAKRPPFFTSP